jgi:hypothetical protein
MTMKQREETGLNDGDLALAESDGPQATMTLVLTNDIDGKHKNFPWHQVMGAMKRICPEMNLPQKAEQRDIVMRNFWRKRGKTVGAFELLAQKVHDSDYLMARNGHKGKDGRPFPWSWIFSKNSKGGLRADAIMDGEYSTEKMAFIIEKENAVKLTKVMLSGATEPTQVNLAEKHAGGLRYRACGQHMNSLPKVIDLKD